MGSRVSRRCLIKHSWENFNWNEVENLQEMIEAEDSLAEETGFVVLEAKKLKSLTMNPYEYKRSSVRIVSASKK